jgi:hypothetical protein
MNGRISLHDMESGKRLTQHGSCKNVSFMYIGSWRTQFLPRLKPWVSMREVS